MDEADKWGKSDPCISANDCFPTFFLSSYGKVFDMIFLCLSLVNTAGGCDQFYGCLWIWFSCSSIGLIFSIIMLWIMFDHGIYSVGFVFSRFQQQILPSILDISFLCFLLVFPHYRIQAIYIIKVQRSRAIWLVYAGRYLWTDICVLFHPDLSLFIPDCLWNLESWEGIDMDYIGRLIPAICGFTILVHFYFSTSCIFNYRKYMDFVGFGWHYGWYLNQWTNYRKVVYLLAWFFSHEDPHKQMAIFPFPVHSQPKVIYSPFFFTQNLSIRIFSEKQFF